MYLPYQDYRAVYLPSRDRVHSGIDSVTNSLVGRFQRRTPKVEGLLKEAQAAQVLSEPLSSLTEFELRSELSASAEKFRRGTYDREDVYHAIAHLVETSVRLLGLRPHKVQIAGVLGLFDGYLVEMATGEGKSLTASLTAILVGWTGRPCHILTVNEYLANRDAQIYKRLFNFCGVSVGDVSDDMDEEERRKRYQRGVIYTTAKQLLADFLRDRLTLGAIHHPGRRVLEMMGSSRQRDELVLRGIDTAIVDEADSVLIDEAVSPLIISRAHENRLMLDAIKVARGLADAFSREVHYKVDEKYRTLRLNNDGLEKLSELAASFPGMWKGHGRREELITQALSAREFYHVNKQYVVKDGKIVIVDEFTGRLMTSRSWGQGLHQAVEANEGLELTHPTETVVRLSFQHFFRLFRHMSGMTGTAMEAAGEFWQVYRLPVLTIPTNEPCRRELWKDQIYVNDKKKWEGIVASVIQVHATQRPVLVGTRNIHESEALTDILREAGIKVELLNALRFNAEADIVALAGEKGQVTIATNMAGRGTDIQLGDGVAELGGLHVIVSERHESGRIDRQLMGRCARQGDPGSTQIFMSPDDGILKRHCPDRLRLYFQSLFVQQRKLSDWALTQTANVAQKSAERLAFRQRKNVLRMDTWLERSLTFGDPEKSG